MSRIAYVNGAYLPHREAAVHVEDRGYQFADGVYEVCEIHRGRLVDEPLHMARLERSLRELRIAAPMSRPALGAVLREVIRRNRVEDGTIYCQVTRGVAPRNHPFPPPDTPPAMVVTARRLDRAAIDRRAESGIAVVTRPDERWHRVDIKTVSLLPNVLARQSALEAGAGEAWLVDRDGQVTEASSSNAWIVDASGTLRTAPADDGVLRGITRTVVLELAARLGVPVREERFAIGDAYAAREAFVTSTSSRVMPVVRIDDRPVGNGSPGLLTAELRRLYRSATTLAPLYATPM